MKNILNNLLYKQVIVIGGGFAGLKLIKKLNKKNVKVLLFDKNNYHCFQPLLYQVATGGLTADSIAYPFRKSIHQYPNIGFRMAEVMEINPEKNEIQTSIGSYHYDYLVIATGAETNFFGNKSLESGCLPMKSIPNSLDLRNYILYQFEKALVSDNPLDIKRMLNFVIVGGGPSGVEMAGALAEIKNNILKDEYKELESELMGIYLIEGTSKLLSAMSVQSSENALKYLNQIGVNTMLNQVVTDYDGKKLSFKSGESIDTETVIWCAGVKGNPVQGINPDLIIRGNRISVDEFNRVKGYGNIFAIGDIASMLSENQPVGHPMVAQVAIQQADRLAINILNLIENKPLHPFKYIDKGSMATIGRRKAVVDLPFAHFHGFFAWFVWMFVHLMAIVGFRNRAMVFINWVWSYFTYEKAIRLIIRPKSR